MHHEPEPITLEQLEKGRGRRPPPEPEGPKPFKSTASIDMVAIPKEEYDALKERAGMSPLYCMPLPGHRFLRDFVAQQADARQTPQGPMTGTAAMMTLAMSKSDAALQLAGLGYRLISLETGGKKPRYSWQQPIALDRILEAFLKEDANLGIVAGPSGIVVLDADSPEAIRALQNNFPPTPMTVATPRDGVHA